MLCVVGALTTVSRTVVLDGGRDDRSSALLVRKQARHALLAAARSCCSSAVHLAAPHTLGSLYHSFFPKGGLVQLADRACRQRRLRPAGGHRARPSELEAGAASSATASAPGKRARQLGEPGAIVDPKTGAPIIFDDQYLNSLVSIGFLGLVGVLWFVWGGVRRLVAHGPPRAAGRCK